MAQITDIDHMAQITDIDHMAQITLEGVYITTISAKASSFFKREYNIILRNLGR
jgi:hypothetical protein